MKILNFGSLNLDYAYQVDHFVAPGETLSARGQVVNCGGKGLNQSIALARAGVTVLHAGCVGQGGGPLKALLEENGVDTTCLREVAELQGNAVIQVAPSGENCILLYGGSNQCVTVEQIERTMQFLERGDILLMQNEINSLATIVDGAYRRGARIVLNPSPYDSRLEEVDFGKLAWLLVNEVEAEQISGSSAPEQAWKILHQRYPDLSLVVTLGCRGSVCYADETYVWQKAWPVNVVDTTAAGDTFTGFFLAGLMEKLPLPDCMELAAAAAAISVTRAGAAASIPWRQEVNFVIEQGGI